MKYCRNTVDIYQHHAVLLESQWFGFITSSIHLNFIVLWQDVCAPTALAVEMVVFEFSLSEVKKSEAHTTFHELDHAWKM